MKNAKSLILLACFGCLFGVLFGQNRFTQEKNENKLIAKDDCDVKIPYYDWLQDLYQKEYRFYEIQAKDVVADIGCMNFLVAFAHMCFVDSFTYYVQELNLRCLTQEYLQQGYEHFSKLCKKDLSGQIYIVQGDSSRSNLPQNTFDKVLLRLVYHEFKHPEQNLRDIYKILKPNGILYVGENLEKKQNKQKKCGLHRTQENLIREIEQEGFVLDKITFYKEKFHIFKFRKK
ncbi:MAG: class I SAM-dependent methyltransferase [Bacteroidia bacterium]|nr:class I SAM-dependent methyltransferase [Bacteroidia bacterium]